MRHERGEDERRVCAGVLDLRLDVVGVVVHGVHATAVREAVDDDRVVGIPVELRLAAPVAPAFERVGQGRAVEPRGIGQHLGDGDLADGLVIEVQDVPRPQLALRARRYDRARLLDGDAAERCDRHGGRLPGGLDLGLLLALRRVDQLGVALLLLGRERRAGAGGVEDVTLMGDRGAGLPGPASAAPRPKACLRKRVSRGCRRWHRRCCGPGARRGSTP